jgi:CRP-like cAMP-binding protein
VTGVDERLQWLREVGIFGATPDAVLAPVVACLKPVSVCAGQTIFAKGDAGDSLYIIVEGRVGVYDGGLLLNYLTQGDVFGEMAILDAQPRSASAIAVMDSHLFRLDQVHVYQMIAAQSEAARAVIEVLCRRVRAAQSERIQDFAYIQQVAMITAAAQDLETGVYSAESLDEVARRTDALGHLARVFQQMAREVRSREQGLKQQVDDLRIEIDQVRQARQVTEIISTEYFQALQQRAQALRVELAIEGAAGGSTVNDRVATANSGGHA